MKKTMYLLVLLLPVFTACTQQVQSESIRFFYSQKCASCQQMKGFLEELMELNADLSMTMTDIDEDPEAWVNRRGFRSGGFRVCLLAIRSLRDSIWRKVS